MVWLRFLHFQRPNNCLPCMRDKQPWQLCFDSLTCFDEKSKVLSYFNYMKRIDEFELHIALDTMETLSSGNFSKFECSENK